MCGSHHRESRLALGPLKGRTKRRRYTSGNGGARDRGAGKLRMKRIFSSVERKLVGSVAEIVRTVTRN
jgi:hypothetical protein